MILAALTVALSLQNKVRITIGVRSKLGARE